MNVEVRATGLRAARISHKLTQRELARRLGVTQNYIPALEAGTRNPGLFQVVMVNPVDHREQVLHAEPEAKAV
jgi:predicted transcriptional regulator